ncbi:hypothetical protein Sbal678_3394 [Shewanella baltica OS678]|nr:hypothetical protein Sbal678_3394 [Shewanella baltica OS678]
MCTFEISNVSCSDIADIRINNFLVYLQQSEYTKLLNTDSQLSTIAVIEFLKIGVLVQSFSLLKP